MCGIVGIVNKSRRKVSRERLEAMARLLQHRGPDDAGLYLSENHKGAGLAHRRLSIIDLEGGHQPLCNEDGTVWVVFNGEVYNYQELTRLLTARGHTFRTKSDTEAIVHMYEEKGEGVFQYLRGMFAFAIWDDRTGRLLLGRDRLGQKPLFYWEGTRAFAFASEVRALTVLDGFPRRVDAEALHHYLTYQYVPTPMSIFEGVRKLPPAHYAVLEDGKLRTKRYWSPPFEREIPAGEKSYVDQVRTTLSAATRMRLISDVPLGAFLSGGMDSSITVGLMSSLAGEKVRTFSIGFQEKRYDELEYARLAAERFSTEHREFVVEPRALEVLPRLVWHFGEPFADSSAIPTYYVSQQTRRFVTVALTGDAGDECFAGYPRYKAAKMASWFDAMPRALRGLAASRIWKHLPASVEQKTIRRRLKKLMAALNLPPEERYLRWICIFDDEGKDSLYTPEFAAQVAGNRSANILLNAYRRLGHRDFVTRTTFVDMITYLPDDLLVKVDITSMACSLETRSPFLDHKVVELAARMPIDLKLRGFRGKYILKKAFADLLPDRIIKRPKMGFGVPISVWFRESMKDFVRDCLCSKRARERGIFDPKAVKGLIDDHVAGRFDHGYRLWALLMLELWARMFIDQKSPGSVPPEVAP